MTNHLVNYLSNSIHHDRPKSYEDLPCVVEEDDVLCRRNICYVDIAGHQANGCSSKNSWKNEGLNIFREKSNESPTEDVGKSSKDEHSARTNHLLQEATEHSYHYLGVVLRCPWYKCIKLPLGRSLSSSYLKLSQAISSYLGPISAYLGLYLAISGYLELSGYLWL